MMCGISPTALPVSISSSFMHPVTGLQSELVTFSFQHRSAWLKHHGNVLKWVWGISGAEDGVRSQDAVPVTPPMKFQQGSVSPHQPAIPAPCCEMPGQVTA